MNAQPEIGGRAPLAVDVEAGKSYWWCACGRSKSQPFCDGSHKGTAFSPVEWKAQQAEQAWFCACKRSSRSIPQIYQPRARACVHRLPGGAVSPAAADSGWPTKMMSPLIRS